ncbi:MAG: hypothetical protein LBI67_07560 [Treponema sp.]|jgi:hypothetical protein|nr:hypothetical protein [Treponema sp.]
MTKEKMIFTATYNLYLHWVKLYFPQRAVDGAPVRNSKEAEDERAAFFKCKTYMKGLDKAQPSAKESYGLRLFALLDTIARREARQFRLGEPIPETITEEADFLFKEVESFFAKDRNSFIQAAGSDKVSDPT